MHLACLDLAEAAGFCLAGRGGAQVTAADKAMERDRQKRLLAARAGRRCPTINKHNPT